MSTRLALLIPVYNEGERFQRLLKTLATELDSDADICVVDDGSTRPIRIDASVFPANGPRIHLLRHPINLGQGAALQTAVEFARTRLESELFVTLDSDGQHDPKELPSLISEFRRQGVDILFGNRFAESSRTNVPAGRKLLLKAALLFERVVTGLTLSDAHNGYRVFNRRCAECLNLRQSRMAHATEFKQMVARNGLRYGEAPVSIRYSEETLAKGQGNLNSVVILKDLLKVYLFDRVG